MCAVSLSCFDTNLNCVIFIQVPALCSKQSHLKVNDVTQYTILTYHSELHREGDGKKGIKKRELGV
jgi:hypothetical protein